MLLHVNNNLEIQRIGIEDKESRYQDAERICKQDAERIKITCRTLSITCNQPCRLHATSSWGISTSGLTPGTNAEPYRLHATNLLDYMQPAPGVLSKDVQFKIA